VPAPGGQFDRALLSRVVYLEISQVYKAQGNESSPLRIKKIRYMFLKPTCQIEKIKLIEA
jgi:hypothetical protein